MRMTPEQIETYFLQRLDPYHIRHSKGTEFRARCPFHGGNNGTALAIDLEDGKYVCFACGEKGRGAAQFEQHMSKAEGGVVLPFLIAQSRVEALIGTPFTRRVHATPVSGRKNGWNRTQASDRYIYTDEVGKESFSVWRFVDRNGHKVTPLDHPCSCLSESACDRCELTAYGRRVWGAKSVRRLLYRLPDVLQSLLIFIVEGEKNANDLSRALGAYLKKAGGLTVGGLTVDRVGVTTNPGGATAWRSEYGYGRYFVGKIVIKLGDNDAPGRQHDQDACNDVTRFASQVFQLPLPVGEGEDISDYLQGHSIEQFLGLLPQRREWTVPEAGPSLPQADLEPRALLVMPSELQRNEFEGGDWLVDRLIPRGSRGLVIAPPKTGKSFFFLDLAIALGTGGRVLGIKPHSGPVRVAIISREDGPQLVSERLRALAMGRGLSWADVDKNIRVNTSEQSQSFRIDNDADLKEMARWLKSEGIEFCVLDVLNKLHSGKENEADDMGRIMSRFDDLARLSGAQVCVIHHTNKGGGARGSSAIESWADFIFRLEADPNDESLKTLHVKTKAGSNPAPKHMRYWQSEDMKRSGIQMLVEAK